MCSTVHSKLHNFLYKLMASFHLNGSSGSRPNSALAHALLHESMSDFSEIRWLAIPHTSSWLLICSAQHNTLCIISSVVPMAQLRLKPCEVFQRCHLMLRQSELKPQCLTCAKAVFLTCCCKSRLHNSPCNAAVGVRHATRQMVYCTIFCVSSSGATVWKWWFLAGHCPGACSCCHFKPHPALICQAKRNQVNK